MPNVLSRLFAASAPPPFAVLRRDNSPEVEVFTGDVVDVERLEDIPLPETTAQAGADVLALVPFRQVREVGFTCNDDKAPLRCLVITSRETVTVDEALEAIEDQPLTVTNGGFTVDDDSYAAIVDSVITDEIGKGEGANFVIRRDYSGHVDGSAPHTALRLFRHLLTGESGAYWTFAIHAGDVTMAGATPERHVSAEGGNAYMNPISGTYRIPPEGLTHDDLLAFLDNPKETEELFMVVDEELKMMSHVCESGGQVLGPYLKPMGHLIHTEYLLKGQTDQDVRDILRSTMFAPTVTGSPVENATRIIAKYEDTGRGYYSGVAALIGHDDAGKRTLDAPILIRTAYIEPSGTIRIPVGATLVRHSVPEHEVAETHAKASGVLAALGVYPSRPKPRPEIATDPQIEKALTSRNAHLAPFWLNKQDVAHHERTLIGHSALIIDAEDRWTAMLAHLLHHLGIDTTVQSWDEVAALDAYDLVIAGPGPGDPRSVTDPRIVRLREIIAKRLATTKPLLAVCLSHQIVAELLGFTISELSAPYQGTQRDVNVFGRATKVGFYNTFVARASGSVSDLEVATAVDSDEVHALRGPGFTSIQFHLESILSVDGIDVLADLISDML